MEYMHVLLWFLFHYFVLFSIYTAAYIFGWRLLKHKDIPNLSGRVFIFATCGIGVIIGALFFIMIFHVFYRSVVLITLIGLVVLCLKGQKLGQFNIFIKEEIRLLVSKSKQWYWLFIPVLLFLFYILFRPLYPPSGWDDISYHLPYAKYYVQNNGLVLNPYLRFALQPHNMNILYSMALLFYDDVLAQTIHASMAILTAVGIYSLGSIIFNRITALAAAIIFLCSPLVLHLMQVAYIDLGLMLFIFCTYYCFSLWLTTQGRFWLYIAGASLGLAIGTKYLGLLFLLLFLTWVVTKAKKTRIVLVFLLIVVAVGSPWYIRNYLISKDPIFPFGGKIFGYSWLWNENDAAGQASDLYVAHGTPRTIKSLLALPLNLVAQKEKFMEGSISLPMLAFFIAFLFYAWGNRHFRQMTIFSYLNLLIWFMTTQILRYFLPVFPFVSLIAAAVLVMFISFVLRWASKPFRYNMVPIVRNSHCWPSWVKGAVLSILLLMIGLYIEVDGFSVKAIPTTKQDRERYLLSEKPGYKLVQIINSRKLTDIYSIGYEDMQYFVEGKMVGDWFGPMRYSSLYPILKDCDKLYEKLHILGIKYFLVNKRRSGQWQINTNRNFQILYENGDGILLKLDHSMQE